LIESELAAWLAGRSQEFDLIVSADTLCYFGALEQALAGAAGALRPGGRIVFTVERAADDVRDYHLDPTGRYSHAEKYVRQVLARQGSIRSGSSTWCYEANAARKFRGCWQAHGAR